MQITVLLMCTDCGSGEGGGLQDTPIEVVHLLLSRLLSPAESDSLGVSSEQKDAFFRTLTKGLLGSCLLSLYCTGLNTSVVFHFKSQGIKFNISSAILWHLLVDFLCWAAGRIFDLKILDFLLSYR